MWRRLHLDEADPFSRAIRSWRGILLAVACFGFGLSVAQALLSPGRPPIDVDAALFEHAGWYITHGAVLYEDIWDIKPPLTVGTAVLLALVSFGDMYVLHLLSVFLTAAVGVGCVVLVGELTYERTANGPASLAAGLTVLSFAGFHWLPATGLRSKYFAMFFGLLGLYLQIRDSPLSSGVAAAASAAFMQHGVVFALLVLGVVARKRSRPALTATLAGMVLVAVGTVLPVVLLGAAGPMVVEAVIVPLTVTESTSVVSLLGRFRLGLLLLGYTAVPVLLGAYGLVTVGLSTLDRTWWMVAGGALYGIQILLVDFDYYDDLLFGLLFVAFGVGLLVDSLDREPRRAITAVVAAVVVVSVVGLGGFGVVSSPIDEPNEGTLLSGSAAYLESLAGVDTGDGATNGSYEATVARHPYGPDEMERVFWEKVRPETCHYRLSRVEVQWVERTNRSLTAETCGAFP